MKTLIGKLTQWFKIYNELLVLPLVVLIFILAPVFLSLLSIVLTGSANPVFASLDAGEHLHRLSLGTLKLILLSALSWWGYKFNFPYLYKLFITKLENERIEFETYKDTVFDFQTLLLLVPYFLYMLIGSILI